MYFMCIHGGIIARLKTVLDPKALNKHFVLVKCQFKLCVRTKDIMREVRDGHAYNVSQDVVEWYAEVRYEHS